MKVFVSALIVALPSAQAYVTSGPRVSVPTFLSSSASADADFSAFADSLEEEPEEVPEKPWQSKLEDLLDPKTNLAERQILLSELLGSNDEISKSVQEALADRKVSVRCVCFAAQEYLLNFFSRQMPPLHILSFLTSSLGHNALVTYIRSL